jgi:hypothetical protein
VNIVRKEIGEYMKFLFFIIFIVCSLYFLSCNKSNPVENTSSATDDEIFHFLTTYKDSNAANYLEFFPDSTFIHRAYSDLFNDNGIWEFEYERTGKYYVDNSVIKLNNVNVDFNNTILNNSKGLSVIWFDEEVYRENNQFKFKSVVELEKENFNSDLHGYWTTIKWVYHLVDSPKTIYSGRQKDFYEFKSDDSTCRCGSYYIDGNAWLPFEYASNYSYEGSVLSLKAPNENYYVQFKYSKMYWYLKSNFSKNGSVANLRKQRVTTWSIEYY